MGQMCCCVKVGHSHIGIKEQWGRFDEVLEPGIHCVNWCRGKNLKRVVSLRLHQLDVKCQSKTKDNVFLTMLMAVQYKVSPMFVHNGFYSLTDPRVQIKSFIRDMIMTTIPKMNANDVYENQDEIKESATAYVQKEMTPYGFYIVKILILEVSENKAAKQILNNSKQSYADEVGQGLSIPLKDIHETSVHLNEVQEYWINLHERNAELHEQQIALEKEKIKLVKASLDILAEVESQRTAAFVGAVNTLSSCISGLTTNHNVNLLT